MGELIQRNKRSVHINSNDMTDMLQSYFSLLDMTVRDQIKYLNEMYDDMVKFTGSGREIFIAYADESVNKLVLPDISSFSREIFLWSYTGNISFLEIPKSFSDSSIKLSTLILLGSKGVRTLVVPSSIGVDMGDFYKSRIDRLVIKSEGGNKTKIYTNNKKTDRIAFI